MTYYRLHCNQNGNYMATGYNAESKGDLFSQYASYKSNDWDDDDESNMTDLWWNKMTDEEKWNFILDDMFEIEQSTKPFQDLNW